jgi:protocatechuate 4,5-dioxygenase alpha chain
MTWKKHDYDDIPGTYVFDGKTAHSSYRMNKLLYSFNHAECRKAFDDDPEAYADRFGVTPEQKAALVKRDFLQMLRLGANIYFAAKLAVPAGVSVQDAGAQFQGITTDEFKAKLMAKGNDLQEKLAKAGGYWNG